MTTVNEMRAVHHLAICPLVRRAMRGFALVRLDARRSCGPLFAVELRMGILGKLFNGGLTTDAIELLTAQHKEVDELLEKIEKGEGNRRDLFMQVANNLAAHATIEEKIFYPAVMAKDTNELLQESVEEHLAIKRLLADLIMMKLDKAQFDAKLSVLKEQVSHHAHKEEEAKLFPKVQKMFSAEERAGLGGEMLAMFEDLMANDPAQSIPSETEVAAPLPRI